MVSCSLKETTTWKLFRYLIVYHSLKIVSYINKWNICKTKRVIFRNIAFTTFLCIFWGINYCKRNWVREICQRGNIFGTQEEIFLIKSAIRTFSMLFNTSYTFSEFEKKAYNKLISAFTHNNVLLLELYIHK